MDIAATATRLSQARTQDTAQLLLMKKAMKLQASSALQLIAAIAPVPSAAGSSANLPAHLGQNIDTTA